MEDCGVVSILIFVYILGTLTFEDKLSVVVFAFIIMLPCYGNNIRKYLQSSEDC